MIPVESELFDNRILTNETIRRVGEEAGFPADSAADGDVRTKKASIEYERRWNPSGFIEAIRRKPRKGWKTEGRGEFRGARESSRVLVCQPVARDRGVGLVRLAKGHTVDVLASRGDEGRWNLR